MNEPVKKPFYESLKKSKEDGASLSLSNLSPAALGRLHEIEMVSDSRLADLFDVSKQIVAKQRKQFGLTDPQIRVTFVTLIEQLHSISGDKLPNLLGSHGKPFAEEILRYVRSHGYVERLSDILGELPETTKFLRSIGAQVA